MSLWSRPGDDGLTASDRLIRDLKREGLPDAEIATRVGIPVSDVKQRLQRLTAAPSTPAPRAPKRPAEPERGRPVTAASPGVVELGPVGAVIGRHWRLLGLGVSALFLAALVAGWAWRGSGSADPRIISITPGAPVYDISTTAAPAPVGITVTGSASAVVRADKAYIMPAIPIEWAPTEGDRIVLTNRLRAIGIPEEALEVEFLPRYGGLTSVAVAVPVDSVPEMGPRVEEVLRDVAFGPQVPVGVSFALADCTRTLAGVREESFADAVASAEGLARATGRQLGPAIAISEELESAGSGQTSVDSCPQSPTDLFIYGDASPAFDNPPEVSVSVRLSVTFAFEGQDAQGAMVAAVGTATVSAEADVAYLVARASGTLGDTLTRDARWDEMIAGLRPLGISEDAVSLSSSSNSARVAVRVLASDAAGLADAVLPLLRAYIRVIQADGVSYAVTDCEALVLASRQAALQNAAERAEGLALNLGGSLGPVVSVSPLVAPFDECPTGPADGDLVPPSSPARVTIRSALQVTFAVEPPD